MLTSFLCRVTNFLCPEFGSLRILVTHSIVGCDADTVVGERDQPSDCVPCGHSTQEDGASVKSSVVWVTVLQLVVEV